MGDFIDYVKKESGSFTSQDFVKYALHGFQRNIYTLLEMVAGDRHEYYSKHMRTIREALRQQKRPRIMVTQKRGLNVNWKALKMPLLEVQA